MKATVRPMTARQSSVASSTPGCSWRSCVASVRAGRSCPSPTLAVRMRMRGGTAAKASGRVCQARPVLALLALVVSIAAADSLNPSTLGPALYFASGRHGRRDVAEFAIGVLVVSFAGGLALTFGPGHELLHRVKAPSPNTVHVIELFAGGAALPLAALLWRA